MTQPPLQGEGTGRVLVALQFGLLAWLAWRAVQAGALTWTTGVAGAAGLLLGLWALASNPPGNFHIRPTPHPRGHLVCSGPYRWIRHPMYVAVLLAGGACAGAGAGMADAIALVLLAAVLVAKSVLEERWMQRQHPGYADYRARTARFVPGVF